MLEHRWKRWSADEKERRECWQRLNQVAARRLLNRARERGTSPAITMSILREIYEAAKIREARHARNVLCSCLSVFMLLWRFVYGTLSSGPGGAAPSSFSTIGRKLFFTQVRFLRIFFATGSNMVSTMTSRAGSDSVAGDQLLQRPLGCSSGSDDLKCDRVDLSIVA